MHGFVAGRVRLLYIAGVLSTVAGCDSSPFGPEEARSSGTYVLERVENDLLPVSVPAQPGCARQITEGELRLSPPVGRRAPLYAWWVLESESCPASAAPSLLERAAEDVGRWSVVGDQVRFTPESGATAYVGELRDSVDGARLTLQGADGTTYSFRLVRPWSHEVGYLEVAVVDGEGRLVAGALLEFRAPDGIVTRAASSEDHTFTTSGPPGDWTVTLTAPPGYSVGPSQDNPQTASVETARTTSIRFVLVAL